MSDLRRYRPLALAVALAATPVGPALAAATTWKLDPAHSGASFSVRHLMVSNVRGQFGKVTGTLMLDEADVTKSSVEASIDVSTVDTGIADRDTHLKSEDFFAADKHPAMTFKSRSVAAAGEGKLKVVGDLTIRGVTKEVTLDVEGPTASIQDPWGNTKRGASATTRINRKDFGLAWSKTLEGGGLVVGDEVTIWIDVELTKEKPAATADNK